MYLFQILGDAELSVKLNFNARAFSASATEKLEAACCSLTTVLPERKKWAKPWVAKNIARVEEYLAKKRATSDSADSHSTWASVFYPHTPMSSFIEEMQRYLATVFWFDQNIIFCVAPFHLIQLGTFVEPFKSEVVQILGIDVLQPFSIVKVMCLNSRWDRDFIQLKFITWRLNCIYHLISVQ